MSDSLPFNFGSMLTNSRSAEVLEASLSRHKLDIQRGDKLPLEIRAIMVTVFLREVQMLDIPKAAIQTLTSHYCTLGQTLDPELFIQNIPYLERASKNLNADIKDLISGHLP